MEAIKVNLIPNGIPQTCHASQYDVGRQIRLDLFDGFTPYVIQSGDTFTLNVRKPDNHVITETVTGTEGNTHLVIETTEQMTAVMGKNLCKIRVENDGDNIGSLNFIMQVEKDVIANGIPSESVIEDLDALVAEAVGDDFYTKSEVYTKAETDAKVSGLIDDAHTASNKTWSSEKIDEIKSDVDECKQELGLVGGSFVVPTGLQAANYENSTHTRKFKYENGKLDILIVQGSTGNIAAGEVTTTSASLTIGESLAIDLTGKTQCFMKLDSTTTFVPTAQAALNLRYYNASYSSSKTAYHYLTNAEGVLVDVVALAAANEIDLATYPNLIIRGLSYFAHETTEAETESVSIYGFGESVEKLTDKVANLTSEVNTLSGDVEQNTTDIAALQVSGDKSSSTAGNVFQLKPYYAHLFINTISDAQADTYVPSQSIYDIEIAKRLGFDVIEANTHVLSDGNYIVLHGVSNKFGSEFVANPNSTYTDQEIQNTEISTVSLDWIRANVIYKAKYPKMQIAPPTLQEFLYACRENNMIPYINYKAIGQVAIADEIMGKDNYIMYGAGRAVRNISKCMIASWENRTTKQSFYDWVDGIGTPCMVGVTHYENFSLSDWEEIAETVHSKGGLIAFAYMTPSQAADLLSIGFDAVASQFELNPNNSGNLANISGDVGFTDFTVVNGTEANAQLTMTNNGTVTNAVALSSCFLSGMWLEVTFKGSISVEMGRFITHSNSQITSNDKKTVKFSTYALNSTPTFEVKARSEGTIIENIVFKASKL